MHDRLHESGAPGGPSLIVDVRETAAVRGFHALAAARLVLDAMPATPVVVLTNGTADERLALQVLTYDIGRPIAEWSPATAIAAYLPLPARRRQGFAVGLAVLAGDRTGWRGRLLRRVAAVTVVGWMGHATRPSRATVVDGHDTRAVADAVVAALRSAGPS